MLCATLLLIGVLTMAGEIRYFINGQWTPKSQLPASIIEAYDAGMLGAQPRRDPETGRALRTPEGEIDYEAIPMSDLGGGSGTDTLAGGGGDDNMLRQYGEKLWAYDSANLGRVDRKLVDIAKEAAAQFPYEVRVTPHGGRNTRRGGTPNHPGGFALDFQIKDPVTGQWLANYQNPSTFRTYEKFAQTMRQIQLQKYPELTDTFRFGGYFGGRYGFDQMHVDVNPSMAGATSMGSWEYGLGRNSDGTPIEGFPSRWRNTGSLGMGDVFGSKLASMGYTGPDAVARFQADHPEAGPADGILGPNTMRVLAQVSGPITSAARLSGEPSGALGARLASEAEVPPSYPTAQETAALLRERGYSGPDAIARFQADNMGLAGTGGRTGPEFFAALTNPGMTDVAPPSRPTWAPDDATSVDAAPPVGLRTENPATVAPPQTEPSITLPPPRPSWAGRDATTSFQKPPDVAARVAGAPAPAPDLGGPPTPRTRPAGLEADNAGATEPTGYRRLRLGSRGEDVYGVQAQLLAAGFDPGPLDGSYGPRTARAVMEFQRAAEAEQPGWVGGKVDAIAGPFTQAALFERSEDPSLRSLTNKPPSVRSPDPMEVGMMLGRTMPAVRPEEYDPSGGTGRDSRPPGTAPAGPPVVRRPLGGVPELSSGDMSMALSRRISPMEGKSWNPWGGMGATIRETPLTSPDNPDLSRGLVVGKTPEGAKQPAPLSPTAVIAGMGGTGSTGLGAAGPGSGPGAGFSDSGAGPGYDDDDDTLGGYNESFSTTGWL